MIKFMGENLTKIEAKSIISEYQGQLIELEKGYYLGRKSVASNLMASNLRGSIRYLNNKIEVK